MAWASVVEKDPGHSIREYCQVLMMLQLFRRSALWRGRAVKAVLILRLASPENLFDLLLLFFPL